MSRLARFTSPADLADPRLKRLILSLALPSVLGLLINALYHVANAAFVGGLGTPAVAAISLTLPIFSLVAALGEGIGVGVAATLGRLLGQGRTGQAGAVASTGLMLAAGIGLGMTALLLIGQGPVIALLGGGAEVAPLARIYLGILAFSCVLTLIQIVCDFIAISEGNSRFSMYTLLGSFAVNIALDPLLIFWMDMGLAGAAWATLLAKGVALGAYAVYFARRWGSVVLHPRLVRTTRHSLAPILSIGLPATAASILTAVSFALMYYRAGQYGGDSAVAAIGIAARVVLLGYFPIIGFCLGAQAVLSYAHGAGDYARLRAGVHFMLAVTTAFAAVFSAVMLLLPDQVVRLFSDDAGVRQQGTAALIAFHLFFLLAGLECVLLVLLQSLGKGRLSAVVALAQRGYLLLPLLLALPLLWGLDGVIAGPALAAGLAGLITVPLFLWQFRRLRRPEPL